MKITLPTALRKALLALCVLCASTLYAEDVVRIDIDNFAQSRDVLFNNDEDVAYVTMKFTGDTGVGADADYFPSGTTNTTNDDILVESWVVGNGHNPGGYTFEGKVHGDGDIIGWSAGDSDGRHEYTFNGDMSEFSGDITSGSRGLALTFGGEARTAVSGTGAISITHHNDGVTYNVGTGTSTIENSSIVTNEITFNGVAGTVYNVSSAITAGALSSNGATVNMLSGSSLAVTNTAINATSLNLSLSDSTLSAVNGSSIGSLTLDGNAFLNLALSADQAALTTTSLTLNAGAMVTINATIAGGLSAGQSYTLLDNANALTDISQFTVDFGAGASTTGLSIDSNGNLIYTASRASVSLEWAGGSDTWSTGSTNWAGEDAEFASFDSVTFSNASAGSENTITISGNVVPSAITVTGVADTTFAGTGKITGTAALLKTGVGTLTIANGGNDFTGGIDVQGGTLAITSSNDLAGGVTVRADATLLIDADNALGSGSATIASGGTIAFKGLDHYSTTTVTRANGSTLKFIYDADNVASNTDATLKLTTGSLSGGRTLAASGGGTISIGGAINAASTTDRYVRQDEGYTVSVAPDTILQDNVRLGLSSGTTTITGGGVYEVHSVELSDSSGSSNTTLTIEQDTTLKVTSTVEHEDSGKGGFMLSNYDTDNTVNVAGTLDLAGGISDRDGEGTISVASTGTLIMREGLITHTGRNNKNVDINGGTLLLYSQADGSNHAGNGLDVDIANGSTIMGASATTRVSTALGFSNAEGDIYTFASAPASNGDATANTISLRQTMTASNATVKVSSGTLEFGGANNTIGTAELSAGTTLKTDTSASSNMTITTATLAAGAAISSNNMSVGGVTIAGKGGTDATIVAQTGGGSVSAATFDKVNLSNATITGSLVARSVENIISNGSSYENVSFTNVNLTAKDTLTSLTNVTLTNVNLLTVDTGHFNLEGNVSIIDSTLDVTAVTLASGANITYSNTTLTGGITATKTNNLTFNTLEGGEAKNVQAWSIHGVSSLFTDASGKLILDLGELSGYTTLGTGDGEQQFAAFILVGVASLGDMEYDDITLQYSANGTDYTQGALGRTTEGGAVVLYIPEPSTATLSLLALAALAARRRRKSA